MGMLGPNQFALRIDRYRTVYSRLDHFEKFNEWQDGVFWDAEDQYLRAFVLGCNYANVSGKVLFQLAEKDPREYALILEDLDVSLKSVVEEFFSNASS